MWELLRSYTKLKVNIAPRKITRLFLPQVTEIDVIVNVTGPFSAQSQTTSPYFIRAGASAGNSSKYLESRNLGVNCANDFGLLNWLKRQGRQNRRVLTGFH